MTYQETLDWMFGQLPMYQRQGQVAFKKDLTNILAFSEVLGAPHKKFKTVHVGGTNGKGSSSHMLASVLQAAGYRVGLYTSPHLKDYTERIRIDGQCIEQDFVVDFIQQHKVFLEEHRLSFFEMSVGLAFAYFASKQVDVAIIEVGLGGRLDSTNIITPELSLITNIGKDHTAILGETLEAIALEKAGIIKSQVPVVIGEFHPETHQVFEERSLTLKAPLYWARDFELPAYIQLDLKGTYQQGNARGVMACVEVLKHRGWSISNEAISKGFSQVVQRTGLRGRWEILQQAPLSIADTAHNKEGLGVVLKQLTALPHEKLHFVLGVVQDKDLSQVLPLFPKDAHYYFCAPQVPRALEAEELKSKALEFGLKGEVFTSVEEAFAAARKQSSFSDIIYVGGSTFVVAEII
ncbi:folylpolyglutamate synthase/dihydrofolate synthase family protein [Mesonia sp. HuA40]|uniref:bifunctional folylpolyglutamate synthase/dihydrofolate synthase n=1 Tax=Mesonia sp. HuA40 TaxID=2602761 RepID=UPI0011CB83F3|nr:folylpolyglutamate synthase/dihydrofolate synthase family protein [Mesonia sp. HuA40]TXK74032.1 bifunctional folylpolyglutamate synthase/dihydrofolate synthase [Mesonia sp. HuA40]